MAVKTIMGFDIAPGALMDPGIPYAPVKGKGLEPYLTMYGLTYTTDNTVYSSVGVTGRTEDRMSNGANAMVVVSGQNINNASMTITGGPARPMSVNTIWRYTIGFRFKIDPTSATQTSGNITLLAVNGAAILHINGAASTILFAGSTIGRTITKGQEYYFEVTLDYPTPAASGNYSPQLSLAINGEFIVTRTSLTLSSAANCIFQLGCFGRSGSGLNIQRWLISDIYITDLTGEAPFNGRLGPQRVKPFYPDEVVSNEWTMSEGNDPLALIGQGARDDDTKYISSPEDEGLSSYRMNMPTTSKSVVNGILVFGKARREDGASRSLLTTITKADGTVIASGPAVALTSTLTLTQVAALCPTNAAEAANLKDSVLQNAVFSLKALT